MPPLFSADDQLIVPGSYWHLGGRVESRSGLFTKFGGSVSESHKENVGLDVIRGLAALLVVLGHTRTFLGEAFGVDLTGTIWQKVLLLPSSFAQESVAVFFVLSGYLVGGQVLRLFREDRFRWGPYMAKRLSRLWTVLVPGIALTFLLDMLTMRLFAGVWSKLAGGPVDAVTAACNVAFLQVPHCYPYGTNDSLWSLAYEFWFYVIFPAGAAVVWGVIRRNWISAVSGLVVTIAVIALFGVGLLALIPVWLLGVVLAVVHKRWKASGVPAWFPQSSWRMVSALAAVTFAAMLASNVVSPPEFVRFLVVGLACAPLILLTAVRPWKRNRVASRLAGLGTVSFSLYVFHLPLVKFILGALSGGGGFGDLGNVLAVYVIAALVTAACAPLWFATERNTGHVRDLFLRVATKPAPRTSTRTR